MPYIYSYKCNQCDFHLPPGWGGYTYVEDSNSNRILCAHPLEFSKIEDILGEDASEELISKKKGFNSYCVFISCLHQFEADLGEKDWWNYVRQEDKIEKDKRLCPICKSKNVKTEQEMVGELCPKCRKGTIETICIGIT